MRHIARLHAAAVACVGLLCGATPVSPHHISALSVRGALEAWMADFNARRVDRVCSLFSRGLRSDYRGLPERNYQGICTALRRSLTDPTKRYHYGLEVKDIVTSGDLAVAHVVWTLRVTSDHATTQKTTREYSMDVFRHAADGRWMIDRFVAYEAP